VDGELLCGKHTLDWAFEEMRAAEEETVARAQVALDAAMDEPIEDDWDAHVRRCVMVVLEALRG
jgi:hypothetical protein